MVPNLTNFQFSTTEMEALSLGLKFAIAIYKNISTNIHIYIYIYIYIYIGGDSGYKACPAQPEFLFSQVYLFQSNKIPFKQVFCT